MNEQNMRRLHESLGKLDSNFTRTFDEFAQDMQDDSKRRRLHASLGTLDGNFTRTYEEFSQDMGFPVEATQERIQEAQETAQRAKTEAPKVEDVLRPEDYEGDDSFYGLSDDDLRGQIEAFDTARNEKREQMRQEIKKSKGFLARLGDAMYEAQSGISSSQRDEMIVNSTMLDPKDEERYNRLVQEQVWRQRQDGSEYEQLGQSLVEAKQRLDATRQRDGKSLDTGGAGAYLDKALDLYQAPSKFGNNNGIKNWAVGLGDQLADYDTWTVGVTEMARAINLNALVNKLNNGEELTESEEAELEAFLLYGLVQDARQNDLSVGYTIGKGTAESIPFMAEMLITAGAGAAAQKGLVTLVGKASGKVAAERLARAFGKKIAGTETTNILGKKIETVVLKKAEQGLAERAARQVGEDVLMTAFMPTTWAAVNEDAVEEKLDPKGDHEYGFMDFLRTFAGATIETGTEHWGGKIVDKALGKVMPLDKIWGKTRWGKLLTNDFIQSPFGETGEEYVGAIANYLRSYDPAYSDKSNELLRNEARQMFSIDGFMQTFLTVLPMSVGGGTVNVSIAKHHISAYKETKGELISLLKDYGANDEQAANIVMQIEGAEDTQSFTEMLAQTERTLRLEYMNAHPDAKVEELNKHFEQLDKLIGKYYKHAYYLNEMSGELQNAYSQLTDEQQQQVMSDFATAISMQAKDADERINAEMEKRAKSETAADGQEQAETKQETAEEPETEAEEQKANAENPEKPEQPKQIIPRELDVQVNGVPMQVHISGKGVYEEDGTINFSGNRRLYLTDTDGSPIPASLRSEIESAINEYLKVEKENGDALMAHDQPIVEETPVQEKPVQEEPIEEERLYPVLEDGSPDFANMSPEQQVAYAAEVGGEEAAIETIQTAIEELNDELASVGKKKGLVPVQRIAERNRIGQLIAEWQALMPQAEESAETETPGVETPEAVTLPISETPEVEQPAEQSAEEPITEQPEQQEEERINLQDDGIVILLHDISDDKVPLLKVARVLEEDGKRVYREIGNDKELSASDGYWREMPKQLIHDGEVDYVNVKYREYGQQKRLGIPLYLTPTEIAAINAQNENRPKVEKLPNRGLTPLSKDAKGQGIGYFADMALDGVLEEPLTKIGNTGEVFTLQDLLALSPMMITNENGRKARRSIWNQVDDWCEQAAIRSMRKATGGEFSEERMKELKSQLLSDIKKKIPQLMDGWNAVVKKKGIDQLFDATVKIGDSEVPVMDLLDEELLTTYKQLRKAIFGEEVEGNPTLIFPPNKRRFTEGWYNPAKNAEHPMGNDANIFRYMQVVGELARQLQDQLGLEDASTSFLNVEKTFVFPYNRTVERGREKRNDNTEKQYRELLDKIANAKDIKELRKIAQVRYSWQEQSTRNSKNEAYDANPNYDADKTNAVYEALSQRAADFGATLAMLQTDDAMQAREEKEMSEEERAAAAAAADMAGEQKSEADGLAEQIESLEKEHAKAMEQLAMARERKNEDMAEMLLEKVNDLSKQIFALRQQMVRSSIRETEQQTKWRKEHGRRVVNALRKAGADISLVSEEEMFSFFDAREVRLMKTNGSVPYGVEVDGKIYILDDYLDPNTPVHEYTHLWFDIYAHKNPSKWAEITEILKQTDAWQEVLNDDNYFDIHDNEYEMTSEVLARLTGDYWSDSFMGSTRFDDVVEQKKLATRVRAAVRSVWETICGWFDQKISRRNKDFDAKLRDILNMPMQNVIRMETDGLTDEEQAIKERAQADGTFMKAPNGQPTNLTEKQWLQVRTEAFKKWFGDWEKMFRIKKLRESEPVNVEFNGEYELNRDAAKAWALANVRGEYTNADTGDVIDVFSEGINEVTSHGEREEEHLKSLIAIPQMIEQSIFIEELGNEKDNNKYDTYRYYVCGLRIDNEDYTAKIVVGVKNGKRYYDHRLTKIEKGSLIDSLHPMANRVANNEASKIDGKDTKLFSILQINSSNCVDFNGEPLVLYRGSKEANSYVFRSRYQTGAVWFTDDREVAQHYATRYADHALSDEEIDERIQPVFLNVRDASVYDSKGRGWEEAVEEPVYFVLDDNGDVVVSSRDRAEVEAYCRENGLDPDVEITESKATGDVAEVDMMNGKDGVVFEHVIDGGDKVTNVWVVKQNTQAKSATINVGSFDGANPDIRFRMGQNTNILENEEVPVQPAKRMNWLQRKVNAALDQANGLRLLMQHIGEIEGKKVRADEDVREALEAKRSKITNILTRFGTHERRHLKKALRTIQKSIKATGLWKKGMTDYYISSNGTRSDRDVSVINVLEMYLMAKDTLERISQGKEVRSPELTFRSLQLLGMPTDTELSTQEQQMTVLQALVDKFESTLDEKQVSDLWAAVNECTQFTLKRLKEGGLLGENVYRELMKSKFYVPERGFAQLESDEDVRQEVDGRKRGTRGTNPEALRKAHGGESMATDVIANILHLATNSVACAEENKVRQAAFKLLLNHGEACRQLGYPAAEQVWYVRDGFNEDGSPRYTAQVERPSAETIAQNEEVLELIRGYREDLELFAGNKTMQDHIKQLIKEAEKELLIVPRRIAGDVALSRAGLAGEDIPKVLVSVPTEDGDVQQYTMVFPNQREIANALNGVLSTKFSDSWLKSVGHFFSSMFTTYNPLFWSRNLPRDVLFVLQKGTAERGVGYGAFFAAEMARPATTMLPVIEHVMGLDIDSREAGTAFSADGAIERDFRAFLDGGGNTGFTQLKDIGAFRKEADKLVNGENPIGAGLGFIFKEVPAALNEFSELWTRFAVYRATKASLAMENRIINTIGRGAADIKRTTPYSEEEIEAMALHDSRNFSTNFNRRGAGGFVDFFNSISIFANASIQGATGVYRTFEKGEWQKGIRGAASLMFVPALLGYILTKMTPDDDDKEKWIPDYIRQNNIVFLDKRVPLSYELVPWYRIGVNYALMEQGRLSKTDGIENIAMGFAEHSLPTPPAISEALKTTIDCVVPETDFNGKNPSMASAITSLMQAQFMSSFVELEHGKTWTGSNLRYSYAKDQPQWMFQDYEAELYKDISKGLYKVFGKGDMDNPSITVNGKKMNDFQNMSPKEIKNYIGSVTPNGWLKIACYAWGLGKDVAKDDGEEYIRDNDKPFISDFTVSDNAEMGRIGISAEMSAMIREAKENYTRIDGLKDLDQKEADKRIKAWDKLYKEYTNTRLEANGLTAGNLKAQKRRLERAYGIRIDGESADDLLHAYIIVMANEQIEAKGLERTIGDMEKWRSKYQRERTSQQK